MDISPTTHKVVFSFLTTLLTLCSLLALSQQPAFAISGFTVRSAYGYSAVRIRTQPSTLAQTKYVLPNGASLHISCKLNDPAGKNWFQLEDKNYILQVNTTVPVSSTVIPTCDQSKLYADRTILQASGPNMYVIQSSKILVVPNIETLLTCLGGPQKITVVSDEELHTALQTYPNGGTAACPVSYPNGTTLLAASGSTVLVVANGQLFGVPTSETLFACLGGWNPVRNISDAEMNWVNASYPYSGTYLCPAIPYADNTLLQASGPGVYLVRSGNFYGIPDPTILQCYGGWDNVHHVSDSEILRLTLTYPNGGSASCPYYLPNGSKLYGPVGAVYFIQNGRSFGIPSPEVLTACYGGWAGVRGTSQAEIDTMLATYPYAGTAGCALSNVDTKKQHAIDWANSQLGNTRWNGYCELMVEQAYNTSGQFGSALDHANYEIAHNTMNLGDTNVPAGALAYFGAASVNGGYGHIMLSIGNGQFISNGYSWNGQTYGARITTIATVGAGPYIGWSEPDSSWPGR